MISNNIYVVIKDDHVIRVCFIQRDAKIFANRKNAKVFKVKFDNFLFSENIGSIIDFKKAEEVLI